jgi:hypothetical protein
MGAHPYRILHTMTDKRCIMYHDKENILAKVAMRLTGKRASELDTVG